MIVASYSLSELAHEVRPLRHHKAGLQFTRSGYGRRIPTQHMVRLPGSTRWRRVYVCIYSNAGTAYVDHPNGWITIHGAP